MQLFHISQCSIQNRNEHISVLNGALWYLEQMHSRIYKLGQKDITNSTAVIGTEHQSEFKLKKTTHILPLWVNYAVNVLENTDHVTTALHCLIQIGDNDIFLTW